MRVLLTNDDGIDRPGLAALEEALCDSEVWVVAPADHCSGAGQSLGLYAPLAVERLAARRWAVEGTPTDCVKLALTRLLDDPPDIVISGINAGANLGNNVFYSGTVAAATEAAMWGHPALAVSLEGGEESGFPGAASVTRKLLEARLPAALPRRSVLNVNVPASPAEPGGYVWTRTARFSRDIPFEEIESGRLYRYGRFSEQPVIREEGTDVAAVKSGLVSLTLLSTDRSSPDDPPGLEMLNGGAI
jgi:5'-nucleotidase